MNIDELRNWFLESDESRVYVESKEEAIAVFQKMIEFGFQLGEWASDIINGTDAGWEWSGYPYIGQEDYDDTPYVEGWSVKTDRTISFEEFMLAFRPEPIVNLDSFFE